MTDIIDRKALLDEVEKVYNDHYKQAYDQTIHDLFNAVRKRIRRAQAVKAVEAERYPSHEHSCLSYRMKIRLHPPGSCRTDG